MTLPKTHPLYGAMEAGRKAFCLQDKLGDESRLCPAGEMRLCTGCAEETLLVIRALESAGYRVVGPESIGTMASAVPNPFVRKSMVEDMLSAAIAAAPTITETEKGAA